MLFATAFHLALKYAIRKVQENQVELKLNGTHHLLVYADDVSLLEDNIDAYLLMKLTLLEKLPLVQLLKNFPAFYGTQTFITVFTRAFHWSLS
jgi:hypothetical protein